MTMETATFDENDLVLVPCDAWKHWPVDVGDVVMLRSGSPWLLVRDVFVRGNCTVLVTVDPMGQCGEETDQRCFDLVLPHNEPGGDGAWHPRRSN